MASRGDYAAIYTGMADDPDFLALSPAAKLVTYTLKMILGPSGIDVVRACEAQLTALTGYTATELRAALEECERARWVVRQGNVVWLRNALRYNPSLSMDNEKHRKGVERHLRGMPRQEIVNAFAVYYSVQKPFEGMGTEWVSPENDTLSKPYAIQDTETETETDEGSGDKSPGAGADVENPRGEAVGLIFALWGPKHDRANPPPFAENGKPWDIANELSIWDDLVRADEPDVVNRAIAMIRTVGRFEEDEPLSLKIVHSRKPRSRGLWSQCLGLARSGMGTGASLASILKKAS